MNTVKRVLFFGFSVTEQKDGYALVTSELLKEHLPEVEVTICGLGGMHPPESVHIFDSAVPRGEFDLVILELMTTSYRYSSPSTESYGMCLIQLLAKAARRGAQTVVLNLPRSDVEYENDEFTRVARCVCDALSTEFADLASELQRREDFRDLIPDGVHTTPQSAQLFAEMLMTHIRSCIAQPAGAPHPALGSELADHARAILVSDLMPYAPLVPLSRSYSPSGIAIPGGTEITLALYGETEIAGLTYFMGPKTGKLYLRYPDGTEGVINAYDAFCYYDRLNGQLHPAPKPCNKLSIYQDPSVPELPLHKGEKDFGERRGVVVQLLVHMGSHQKLVDELRWCWAGERA